MEQLISRSGMSKALACNASWQAYPMDTTWRAYSLDVTIEGARSLFEQRYGIGPQTCFVCGPIILAGPLAVERGG